MSWRPDQPYNDLPLLPPAADLETRAILKACIGARAALAELKQAAELMPNPAMLINILPMLEAKDSSEIENIVTTTDKLFQFSGSEAQADPATKEALRYRQALYHGSQLLNERPINTNLAETICSQIKGVDMQVRKVPGTALMNDKTGAIISTPPEGEKLLRDLLGNWEKFLHGQPELDPLVRMAVMHYQFEAIHPFTDGNGRTGRILNSLYLVQEGLLTMPILYLSRHIITTRDQYYAGLLAVTREQAWEEWLLYILDAVECTATWTTQLITQIRHVAGSTAGVVKTALPKIYSRELIDTLFEQPYCRISNLVDAGIAKRQTASEYLKKLAGINVLVEKQVGRELLFINPLLMQLLTSDTQKKGTLGSQAGRST